MIGLVCHAAFHSTATQGQVFLRNAFFTNLVIEFLATAHSGREDPRNVFASSTVVGRALQEVA